MVRIKTHPSASDLALTIAVGTHGVQVTSPAWPGLRIGPCAAQLALSGRVWRGALAESARVGQEWQLTWRFGTSGLVLRQPRRHPWPVGTTFHQSGGLELADVRWDAKTRTLRGNLLRPPGQYGVLTVAGVPRGAKVTATVNDCAVTTTPAANGAVGVPIATACEVNEWTVTVR